MNTYTLVRWGIVVVLGLLLVWAASHPPAGR